MELAYKPEQESFEGPWLHVLSTLQEIIRFRANTAPVMYKASHNVIGLVTRRVYNCYFSWRGTEGEEICPGFPSLVCQGEI